MLFNTRSRKKKTYKINVLHRVKEGERGGGEFRFTQRLANVVVTEERTREKEREGSRSGTIEGNNKSRAGVSFNEIFIAELESSPVKTPANLIILAPYFDAIQRHRRSRRGRSLLIIIHTLVPANPGNSPGFAAAFLGCSARLAPLKIHPLRAELSP